MCTEGEHIKSGVEIKTTRDEREDNQNTKKPLISPY